MNKDTSLAVIVSQSFLKSSPLFQKKELQLNEAHVRSGPPPATKKPPRTKNKGPKPREGKEDVPVKKTSPVLRKNTGPVIRLYHGVGIKLGVPIPPLSDRKVPSTPIKLPVVPSKGPILSPPANGHSPPVTRRRTMGQLLQSRRPLLFNEEDSQLKLRPLPKVPRPVSSRSSVHNDNDDSHSYAYPTFPFDSKTHHSGTAPIKSSSGSGKPIERCSSASSILKSSSELERPRTSSRLLSIPNESLTPVTSCQSTTPLLSFESQDDDDDDDYCHMFHIKPYSVVPFPCISEDQKQQKKKKPGSDDSYVKMHSDSTDYTYIDTQHVQKSPDDEEREYHYVDMNRGVHQFTTASLPTKTAKKSSLRKSKAINKQGSSDDDEDIYY